MTPKNVTCPNCGHTFEDERRVVYSNFPPAGSVAAPQREVRLYKLKEVEKILSVSRATLKRWIAERKIVAVKLGDGGGGTPWRISHEALEDFRRRREAPLAALDTKD